MGTRSLYSLSNLLASACRMPRKFLWCVSGDRSLFDPASKQTTPLAVPSSSRDLSSPRRSTAAPVLWCLDPGIAPAPACRRHQFCRRPPCTRKHRQRGRSSPRDCPDPVGEGRAIRSTPSLGIDLALAVQREMITLYRHQHMGQEPRSRQSPVDGPAAGAGAARSLLTSRATEFGRTCRMTLNRRDVCQDRSSQHPRPNARSAPPQSPGKWQWCLMATFPA